jgi:hypothetical protein
LPIGKVTSINTEVGETWNVATTARLMLDYDAVASVDAPKSLFVKIRETKDRFSDIVPGEIAFYDGHIPDGLPLPIIYNTSPFHL